MAKAANVKRTEDDNVDIPHVFVVLPKHWVNAAAAKKRNGSINTMF